MDRISSHRISPIRQSSVPKLSTVTSYNRSISPTKSTNRTINLLYNQPFSAQKNAKIYQPVNPAVQSKISLTTVSPTRYGLTNHNSGTTLSPNKIAVPPANHREQIEATLTELHRLQSEIYSLNIPEQPHSSAPTTRQIKQLNYLYESMAKPKQRNRLIVEPGQVQAALRGMFPDGEGKQVPMKLVQSILNSLYGSQLSLSLIGKGPFLTWQQLYQFMTFNPYDEFDPIEEAYRLLSDTDGQFSLEKYNQLGEMLGLGKVPKLATLENILGGQIDRSQMELFLKSNTTKKFTQSNEPNSPTKKIGGLSQISRLRPQSREHSGPKRTMNAGQSQFTPQLGAHAYP